MRHQKAGRTLSRRSGHRQALMNNLVTALIEYERIQTTDAKAKELRRLAERTINFSAALGDLLTRDEEKLDGEDRARKIHAMRLAQRVVTKPAVLRKLFSEVGPRFVGRPGGFTRVVKAGFRHGDAAPVSIVELVERGEVKDAPKRPRAKAEAEGNRAGDEG